MRKILLGTTAVVGAALLAPNMAAAQQAPTVRIGGYFGFYYGHITQSNPNSFNVATPIPSNVAINPATQTPFTGTGSAKTGKNDFASDSEIHVFVTGKAANGLSYGATVELAFDMNEGTDTGSARRTQSAKTAAWADEMWAFVSTPQFGQLRFGDEDGPLGGLMNAGIITNFGTGGIYGFWQNFVERPNRTTTSPGDLGDNTKIIYLSPQWFGFDFGASWAFNSGTGQDTGCITSFASWSCDRTYAATGISANAVQAFDWPQRRNEHQVVGRWRGEIAGVGVNATFGHVGWTPIMEMTQAGATQKVLRPGNAWQAGLQVSFMGATLGANYTWGQYNYFWGSQFRGDQDGQTLFVGGSYDIGPVTVGANGFTGLYSGSAGWSFNQTSGVYTRVTTAANRMQQRYGYSVGATYRLAPGLDLVAEYVRHVVKEPGNTGLAGAGNLQDKLRADVIIVGTRLAF